MFRNSFTNNEWIDRVRLDGDRVIGIINTERGERTENLASPDSHPKTDLGTTSDVCDYAIEFDLTELDPVDLSDFGISAQRPSWSSLGHWTWALHRTPFTYLLPGIELLRGIFALGRYNHLLFLPNSPYEYLPPWHGLKVPILRPLVTNALYPPIRAETRLNRETMRTLLWVTSFPSALRGWESVRNLARRGILGCKFPEGRVAASVRAMGDGETWLVTNLVVHQIASQEKPFPHVQVEMASWNLLGQWSLFDRPYWSQTNDTLPFPPRPNNLSWKEARRQLQWTPELSAIFSRKAKADEPFNCTHVRPSYDSTKLDDPAFQESLAQCDNMHCRLMRDLCRMFSV